LVEVSYPFGPRAISAAGKTMTVDQWASMARYLLGTGVMSVTFQDEVNEFLVSPGSSQLQVDIDTGAAWIQGFYYKNDAHNTINIPQNSNASDRIDLIVIECKWGKNAGATAKVIVNPTPGTVAPVPVQVYGVKWQLPLATVTTSHLKGTLYTDANILDQRVFTGSGCAQSNAITVAMPGASPKIRANADYVVSYSPTQSSVDATDTINEALGALPGAGGSVLLSEGSCYTSDTITPPANTILAGIEGATTITFEGGNLPMITCANANVTIQDIKFVGAGGSVNPATPAAVTQTNASAINIDTSSVRMRRLSISNMPAHGIICDEANTYMTGIEINGCNIGNCLGQGIQFTCNYGRVQNNNIENVGLSGITLYASASQSVAVNQIIGNNISGTGGYGVMLAAIGDSSQCWYNTVSNNILTEVGQNGPTTQAGIIVVGTYVSTGNYGCSRNTILGNTITLTPSGLLFSIYLSTGVQYNTVVGNDTVNSAAIHDSGSNNHVSFNL
jgi:hypothetical protein